MQLSMWNVFHQLKFDQMVPMISDGRATAHDVLLIASSYLDDSRFYVGHASDFFESQDDDVLIVHRKDMILIRGADMADVFDELCAIVERFDDWERKLASLAREADCLQEMIDASDDVIGAPLFLYAPDGHALALSSAYGADVHPHWSGLMRDGGLTEDGIRYLRDTIDLPTVFLDRRATRRSNPPMDDLENYIHTSLFPHGRMAAHLVCFGFGSENPQGTEHLLDVLARFATAHMEAYFAQYNPLSTLAAALRDFLGGEPFHEQEMRGLARAIRWDLHGAFRIICAMEIDGPDDAARKPVMLPSAVNAFERQFPEEVVVNFDDVVVLVQQVQSATALPTTPAEFALGISETFHELSECRPFFLQARYEAQRACDNAPQGGSAVSRACDHRREELTSFFAIGSDHQRILAYVPPCIRDLQAHDRANGSSYFDTLCAYCVSGFHPAMAAQLLGVHRNSFAYRLERMREIADMTEVDALAASPTMEGLDYMRAALVVASAAVEAHAM